MSDNRRRYFKNTVLVHGEYKLSITRTGTVYWKRFEGMIRLDSLWISKIGRLSVSLPNGEEIQIAPGEKGPVIFQLEKDGVNEQD